MHQAIVKYTVHLSELYNNEVMDIDYWAGHSNMLSWCM